ncbi:MAG: GDP-mannose 4,6-dehydratase [Bacteroidia bacterium]|nr:GDP-mannose 4,6-dehydratase [Bacteroidia bacterium]
MNILITGGAGFIGSNLADSLLLSGQIVRVVDNLSTGRIENIQALQQNPNFEFIYGDVADKPLMESLVQWADHIYHFAAPVGVKYIMQNPVLAILGNIRGIDVILNLANQYKKTILIASTSEVYGKSLDLLDLTKTRKLSETDYRIEGSTYNHRWAYANTKAMGEFLALAYYKEFGTKVVIARFFNTVGPKQLSQYGMVIPNFIQKALKNEPIQIYGTGKQKRSFIHVSDTIQAITTLMSTEKAMGEVFNIGNPIEITIEELAQKIISMTKSSSVINYMSYEEAYGKGFEDMDRRTADISKLCQVTGFKITRSLEDIIKELI